MPLAIDRLVVSSLATDLDTHLEITMVCTHSNLLLSNFKFCYILVNVVFMSGSPGTVASILEFSVASST